jgi:diguanylate cyclase (GGDEF)-like protein
LRVVDIVFGQDSKSLTERFFSVFDSLSLIKALSQIEIDTCSEKEIIQQALTQLIRYQGLERCSVFGLHDDRLQCIAGFSVEESHRNLSGICVKEYKPGVSADFSVDEGIMGLAFQSGQLQYCSDCSKSEAFKVIHPLGSVEQPGSLACVPIKMGGTVLAVLNASHALAAHFEPWQLHALGLYGGCLGQLLHNHRLINELESEVEKRTRELRVALDESEVLKRRYQQLSTEDELTGLHNRRYFFLEAEAMVSRAVRYGQNCSLMLLDVDFFKQINDKWGHLVGDRVLCEIAQVLKQEGRGGDLIARVGGEEFVIILPEAGFEGADQMANRIQERLSRLLLGGELGTLEITVSIGISYLKHRADLPPCQPGKILDRLYSEADRAMYLCKGNGRNGRVIFEDT